MIYPSGLSAVRESLIVTLIYKIFRNKMINSHSKLFQSVACKTNRLFSPRQNPKHLL